MVVWIGGLELGAGPCFDSIFFCNFLNAILSLILNLLIKIIYNIKLIFIF